MARSYAGFRLVKTLNGAPPAQVNYPLVGATAYYEGEVLTLQTNGSAARASAAGTIVLGVCGANISSSAAATSGGTLNLPSNTPTLCPIYLLDSNSVFEAIMLGSNVPRASVGDPYTLAVSTTHNYRIRATASATAPNQIRIVDFHPDEALTTHTCGRYWVQGLLSVTAQSSRVPR